MCDTSLALCDDAMGFPRILPGSQSLLLENVQRSWWLDRMLKPQHNHRMARSETGKDATSPERRKLIAFDEETWHALDLQTALRESARAGSGQEPGAGSKRK